MFGFGFWVFWGVWPISWGYKGQIVFHENTERSREFKCVHARSRANSVPSYYLL